MGMVPSIWKASIGLKYDLRHRGGVRIHCASGVPGDGVGDVGFQFRRDFAGPGAASWTQGEQKKYVVPTHILSSKGVSLIHVPLRCFLVAGAHSVAVVALSFFLSFLSSF